MQPSDIFYLRDPLVLSSQGFKATEYFALSPGGIGSSPGGDLRFRLV